jgi:hypothetical protein
MRRIFVEFGIVISCDFVPLFHGVAAVPMFAIFIASRVNVMNCPWPVRSVCSVIDRRPVISNPGIVTVRNIESCPVNSSFGSVHPSLTGLLFTPCSGPAGHRRRCRHGRHRRTGLVGGVFTVKTKKEGAPYPGRDSIRFDSHRSHRIPPTSNSICKPKFLPTGNTGTCNSAHKKKATHLLTTYHWHPAVHAFKFAGNWAGSLERSLCFA